MSLTVGKGENAKVVSKRVSLKDRVAISRINRSRKAQGKKGLKNTSDKELPEKPLSDEDKALLKSEGYENASPEVVARLKASDQAKKELNSKYVTRQGSKTYEIKEDPTPSRSVAMRTSGISQVPGLQTNTGQVVSPNDLQSREEQVSSQENDLIPVATETTGDTAYADKRGFVYKPVGSAESGYLVAMEDKTYKESQLVLEKSEAIPTPFGFVSLNDDVRRKIILKGEGLQETAEGKGLLGVERSDFGVYLRKTVGGNLVRFGKNPQRYVGKEIVLPTVLGAGTSIAGGKVLSYVPQGVLQKGSNVILGSAGVGLTAATIRSRSAEEQSPDILFGFLGGARGVKNYDGVLGYVETPPKNKIFSGSEEILSLNKQLVSNKQGKVFVGGRGANKPSKTFYRKQSYGQNYDPNIYRTGSSVVERTPRNVRAVEYLERGKIRATEAKVFKTGEGTMIASRSVYVDSVRGIDRVNAPNRVVAVLPKGGKDNVAVKFTQGKEFTSGNVQKSYTGDIKSSRLYSRPSSQVSLPNDVQGIVLQKVVSPQSIVKNADRVPFSPQNIPFKDYPVDYGSQVPQYELSPNVRVRSSPYSRPSFVRGGFRVRRSGERVVSFRRESQLDTGVNKNELVLVQDNAGLENVAPVKSIVVADRVSADLNPIDNKGFSSLSVKEGSSSGLFDGSKSSFVYGNKLDSGVAPIVGVVDKQDQDVAVVQVPVSVYSNSLVEKQVPVSVSSRAPVVSVRTESVNSVVSEQVQSNDLVFDDVLKQKGKSVSPIEAPVFPSKPVFSGYSLKSEEFVNTFEKPVFRNESPKPLPESYFKGRGSFGNLDKDFGKGVSSGRFRVIVGREGNKIYKDLGVGGEELVKKGFNIVRNSAAATVKVIPYTRGSKKISYGKDFYSKEEGVFVQKVTNRISSSGEKQDIPYASKKKRLTKGDNFNKALLLNKKGFSLRTIRRML